jgi:hypothetical protein
MEDVQDLVLYRGTYYYSNVDDKNQPKSSSSQQEAAVLQQWSKIKRQQQQQPQLQQPQSQQQPQSAATPPVFIVQTKQLYIAFWPATCLAGMVIVLLQFMVFYRGGGNGITGMEWTQEGMTKHSAMLFALSYSAFAWTLSNGLVMNPKKNI